MRSIKISRGNKNISQNRQEVNKRIHAERATNPRVRRKRLRSVDERIALTDIKRASVERAKREGKMKIIGKRRMYYDPTE